MNIFFHINMQQIILFYIAFYLDSGRSSLVSYFYHCILCTVFEPQILSLCYFKYKDHLLHVCVYICVYVYI